ncbi:hypothetical protein H8356DRAFT_1385208, partial [Neocallimastix lanati (nom. inval.)]
FILYYDEIKPVTSLKHNNNYSSTKNLRNNEYKLIIMDMNTHKIEWGNTPIELLDSVEEREYKDRDDIIDVANTFTTYDRSMSIQSDGKYAYISNNYGLNLIGKRIL